MRRERTTNNNALNNPQRPNWIKVKLATNNPIYQETKDIVTKNNLHTVCAEAACPNIGECWKAKHAAVMIMGDICTRSCRFCNVKTGKPTALNLEEPNSVGVMAKTMGLKHLVITSVDRDDLDDGGAEHFAKCIKK